MPNSNDELTANDVYALVGGLVAIAVVVWTLVEWLI